MLGFDRPSWKVLGRGWPHHEASRFVDASGMRWHVQELGQSQGEAPKPMLLLVHGAGASTHSWASMVEALAAQFHVVAVDLPGHAFSADLRHIRPTLPQMAALLGALIAQENWDVRLVAGHSAGAAILARMVLDRDIEPAGLVSFNGAFQPFDGAAVALFPALAKLLFLNPLAPRFFAMGARSRGRIEALIEGTGSVISDAGLAHYQALMRSPGHVAGVLAMMANWDLTALVRAMPDMPVPMLLIAAQKDRAVLPEVAKELAARCPVAALEVWQGVGHLAHEEDPQRAVETVLTFARQVGVLPG